MDLAEKQECSERDKEFLESCKKIFPALTWEKEKHLERDKELLEIWKRRLPTLNWDLSRFDVPFDELRQMRMSPDDAWIYGDFFIQYDWDYLLGFVEKASEHKRARINSVRITHERRKGVCAEKAVAIYGLLGEAYKPKVVFVAKEMGS